MKIRCHNCGKPINFCRIIWNTFVINNIICKKLRRLCFKEEAQTYIFTLLYFCCLDIYCDGIWFLPSPMVMYGI